MREPAVGSVWRARDGRIVRVEEIIRPRGISILPWAKVAVLNAAPRQRKRTQISTRSFGSFLKPHDGGPAVAVTHDEGATAGNEH